MCWIPRLDHVSNDTSLLQESLIHHGGPSREKKNDAYETMQKFPEEIDYQVLHIKAVLIEKMHFQLIHLSLESPYIKCMHYSKFIQENSFLVYF